MMRKIREAIGVLVAAYFLVGCATCISISVQSDVGSFNQEIDADSDGSAFGRTVISKEALSTQVSSSGNFRDRHRVADGLGQSAEIGVDIKGAQQYDYGYTLGDGYVSTGETLDVINAKGISAYAHAINAHGDEACASISISDRQGMASLTGYSNYAEAKSEASDVHSSVARQQFAQAQGENIRIDEESSQADGDTASASMSVSDGQAGSYYGEATASTGMYVEVYEPDGSAFFRENWDRAEASHQANSVAGKNIDITESASQTGGDRAAFTGAVIEDGGIEADYANGYEGKARAGISSYLTHGYGGYSLEEQINYAEASHSISSIYGSSLTLSEGSIKDEGGMAGTSLIAEGMAKVSDMYMGSSRAMIDDYIIDYGDGFVCEWHSDDAVSDHRGSLSGEKAFFLEGARSAEGDISLITNDVSSPQLMFDGYAFGGDRSSIIHNPDGSNTVWVGDGSTAEGMFDSRYYGPKIMDISALAISSDGTIQYKSDKASANMINAFATVYEGEPEASISVY